MSVLLAQGDPTGLSSPFGQLVVLAGLLASLTLLMRWWWQPQALVALLARSAVCMDTGAIAFTSSRLNASCARLR